MAVPTAITDLSATAASNSPAGSDAVFTDLDNFLRAIQAFIRQGDTRAANVASASTADLGAAVGRFVNITGTTTITSFGTVAAGIWRIVTFAGALTLTHNATSLILPGGASITTAAGDSLIAESLGSGNWKVHVYMPAAGYLSLSGGALTGDLGVGRSPSYRLDVNNGDADGVFARFARGATGTNNPRIEFSAVEATPSVAIDCTGAATPTVEFKQGGTTRLSFLSTGAVSVPGSASVTGLLSNIYCYNNTTASAANVYVDTAGGFYRSTSSLRYKSDVHSYSNALQDALNLRPVTYASKAAGDAGKRFLGFIAEEVDAAGIKEAVVYDAEGNPDALHYGQMVAIAIGAIQAQQQQIEALKAQIAALK